MALASAGADVDDAVDRSTEPIEQGDLRELGTSAVGGLRRPLGRTERPPLALQVGKQLVPAHAQTLAQAVGMGVDKPLTSTCNIG